MRILALDIGTTNWKAGIFCGGACEGVARMATPLTAEGVYDPAAAAPAMEQLCAQLTQGELAQVEAVALTGMAEACLMVADDGTPLSPILPWSSTRGQKPYETLHARFGDRRRVTGLPDNPKYGVYKLMALRSEGLRGRWLGVVEYFASLLTGQRATEPTFAARTGCYDVFRRCWDEEYLSALGMTAADFPPVLPSGAPMGTVTAEMAARLGLSAGIPVCIAGHDHLCARFGAGAEGVFCSMGTALVCLGGMAQVRQERLETGLSFGPDVSGEGFVCLGSIQSAGGAVNAAAGWLYHDAGMAGLMADTPAAAPGRLLFFPYLAGSGAPHLDRLATGAFVGLTDRTTRADMVRAVYAGVAYECRLMLEKAGLLGEKSLYACGGLTRHAVLMQSIADVLGMTVTASSQQEATMYGAASLAAERLRGEAFPALSAAGVYAPDAQAHRRYSAIYANGYLPLQQSLRAYDHWTED